MRVKEEEKKSLREEDKGELIDQIEKAIADGEEEGEGIN